MTLVHTPADRQFTLGHTPKETRPPRKPGRARALLAAAWLAALAAAPAARADQTDSAQFDLQLRGISAGTLALSGAIEGAGYAASGRLQSAGLVAWLRKISYDARASGSLRAGKFTPHRYEEKADTGRRRTEAVMDYRAGVPQLKVYNPPRAPQDQDIDPASQGGTVDPLTAAYATLRDIPADQACQLQLTLFDGKRRSQIRLSDPRPAEGGLTCAGEYRRLQGFSADDMAEKSRFPFTLHYRDLGDGRLRVTQVTMDTIYGKGALKRR